MTEQRIVGWKDVDGLAWNMASAIIDDMPSMDYPTPIRIFGIPRGGIYTAIAVHGILKERGIQACIVSDPAEMHCDVIVDDLIDSGETSEYYQKIYRRPVYVLLDKRDEKSPFHKKWVVFPWEKASDESGPEQNITRVLEYLGEDPKREGLLETPNRVIRSYDTLYGGYKMDVEDYFKVFKEDNSDEMVVLKNVEFYSTCEHHMLPFFGKAHIAYIPDGKVIGVSKLARILEVYARRLQIQERLCQQVTNAIEKALTPKGCACVLEAQHFCMTSRGVQKQNSVMVTSSVTGEFRDQKETRAEFMGLIGK